MVLFGKSASYKRAAAKYRDLGHDDLFFLSERTGVFWEARQRDKSEHLKLFPERERNKMQR